MRSLMLLAHHKSRVKYGYNLSSNSLSHLIIQNYCRIKDTRSSDVFIACVDEIFKALPAEAKDKNFGITLDVGHLNIEGEDPLVASEKIGRWCLINEVYLRVHATDNYGKLLFYAPTYSADVHGNVSGRGINNRRRIMLLRSMGHQFDVVAEQIQPLSQEDINTIHEAQSSSIDGSYESFVQKGKKILSATGLETLITPEIIQEDAKMVFRELKFFKEDEIVFAEGDRGDGAYFILEGEVKAITFSKDYEEIVLGELGRNEVFGEMALIDDKPRSAGIVTVTPCEVGFIDKKRFNEFIETRSDLAFCFMAFICLSLFRRILRLDKVYADIKRAFG